MVSGMVFILYRYVLLNYAVNALAIHAFWSKKKTAIHYETMQKQ